MHLLAAQAGEIQQEGEAIDLGQTPGKIIFASAADSELAGLAAAVDRAGCNDVRLANFLRLAHNFSVDLWLENTVQHAKLVVVRLLGGASYWQYGVDELLALANAGKIRLALLPGDANSDPILQQLSTVSAQDWQDLHALFAAGGPDNLDTALDGLQRLANGEQMASAEPSAFPKFSIWWPGEGIVTNAELVDIHKSFEVLGKSTYVPILFYRAALEGAGTGTLNNICKTLVRAGLSPVPIVVSSLKETGCITFVKAVFEQFAPDTIFNLTGFALGLDGLADDKNPFAKTDAPIVQLIQTGRSESQWCDDVQGLSSKDLAMQLVLPELDGRIGGLIVGHKEEAQWHDATQCPLSIYAPDDEGIQNAVELAQNWAKLRQTDRSKCRAVVVLANYPIRDGRIANGVGYDAPQSTVDILKILQSEGYQLNDDPFDLTGNQLIEQLQTGPTNADPQRGHSPAVLPLAVYQKLFAALPLKIREEVSGRWGLPEQDPFCREDGFHLPVFLIGNIAILLQPARGYDRDEDASYHDPDLVPPHAYLAAYLWIKHVFDAHALIHNGKHGNLEWLPGKATALDATSYPLALWGALPHLYPFIVNDPGEGTQAKRRTGAVIIDHLVPPLTRAETYGPLKDLEALLDEYYAASGMDRRRLDELKKRILSFAKDSALDKDIGLPDDDSEALSEIDNFLCELKEAQIRDGLHIFAQAPTGELERDLIVAPVQSP